MVIFDSLIYVWNSTENLKHKLKYKKTYFGDAFFKTQLASEIAKFE